MKILKGNGMWIRNSAMTLWRYCNKISSSVWPANSSVWPSSCSQGGQEKACRGCPNDTPEKYYFKQMNWYFYCYAIISCISFDTCLFLPVLCHAIA
jgi:hypothetical protein